MRRIGIDLDNTVLQWQTHWWRLYMHWFDVSINPIHLKSWDACLRWTHFKTMDEFYAWFKAAGGWDTQPYIEGAAGALWHLKKEAHIPFEFVTARPVGVHVQTQQWAWSNWQVPVAFLGDRDKHKADADVFIDDNPAVIESLQAAGKTVVRFFQPWNEHVECELTAFTWPQALELLKGAL